jgi:hypothetical protein
LRARTTQSFEDLNKRFRPPLRGCVGSISLVAPKEIDERNALSGEKVLSGYLIVARPSSTALSIYTTASDSRIHCYHVNFVLARLHRKGLFGQEGRGFSGASDESETRSEIGD